MRTFDTGETVVCLVTTRQVGEKKTVDTCKITIKYEDIIIIDAVDMTNTGTGEYNYDFNSAGKKKGYYHTGILVTYGGRITKKIGCFTLV